jgi:hypothetical protein
MNKSGLRLPDRPNLLVSVLISVLYVCCNVFDKEACGVDSRGSRMQAEIAEARLSAVALRQGVSGLVVHENGALTWPAISWQLLL